ncbi:MAG: hypothetical protein EXR05_03270 [Acetobacteraceae bacterium]|nr:hypothetical protein [Acetobacteraceae bacterium]
MAAPDDATELYLLMDADVAHGRGYLSALVTWVERGGIESVSKIVVLRCESRAERASAEMAVLCWPNLRWFGLSPAWVVALPLVAESFAAATIGSGLGCAMVRKRWVYTGPVL